MFIHCHDFTVMATKNSTNVAEAVSLLSLVGWYYYVLSFENGGHLTKVTLTLL